MKVKKYYIDEPDTVHCYLNSRRNSCGCGSNLFHYEYNGTNIYGVCNACETRIYEIKEEYIEECLKEGFWK